MKKATIKRRKRVIAAQDDPENAEYEGSARSAEGTPERGTLNPDGSVNLGLRRRPDQPLAIEPRAGYSISGSQGSPITSTDPIAYRSPRGPQHDVPMYLNEENRLASLASIASTEERQPSLSPASFLSSRKRSFSATEPELPVSPDGTHEATKRISSIISILNPADESAIETSDYENRRDFYHSNARSPHSAAGYSSKPVASVASSSSQYCPNVPTYYRDISSERDSSSKDERREALRREAERMRAMLAQKERELAELGHD